MMETLMLVAIVLAAFLVAASGVWVAVVLIATLARVKRRTPARKDSAAGKADS